MTEFIYRTPEQAFDRWVAALKSGEFLQARGALRKGNAFCCLGVMCELAARDGGEQWRTGGCAPATYKGSRAWMPATIEQYLGMTPGDQQKLSRLNDTGFGFMSLAHLIEDEIKPKALKRASGQHKKHLARRRELYALKKAKAKHTITIFN